MKTQLMLIGLLALSLAACDSSTTTTTATSTDTMAAPATDPNMVTTTTTTTTTRPAFQPKPDIRYMDLRSRKMISVRVDTVHHYIVNTVTNQLVDFFIEPGTTDTFYGRNMQMANGYINYGAGSDWTYDESRAGGSMNNGSDMNSGSNMSSGSDNMGSSSTADNSGDNMSTDNGSGVKKMKTNGKETKIKREDGSKIKTNGNETKIKNK